MEVYIMRHGQTVWNVKRIVQGWSENRLSQFGKEQVEKASNEYKNVDFDVIFTSPLMRTMQTTNIMNKPHNAKVIKDRRLIEDKKGVLTGRYGSSLTDEEKRMRVENPKSMGIETFEEIFERTNNFANFLKENKDFQTVLVVTHRSVASMLYSILREEEVDREKFNEADRFLNAQIKKVEI